MSAYGTFFRGFLLLNSFMFTLFSQMKVCPGFRETKNSRLGSIRHLQMMGNQVGSGGVLIVFNNCW